MSGFNEYAFRANVDQALVKIKTILDNTRNPQLPAEVAHEYTDKYLLAEFITNTGRPPRLQPVSRIPLLVGCSRLCVRRGCL
jgi:hypothetical protein